MKRLCNTCFRTVKTSNTEYDELCLISSDGQATDANQVDPSQEHQKSVNELEKNYGTSKNIKMVIQQVFNMIGSQQDPSSYQKYISL